MKLLFDFFPIIIFFIAYKIWGIYIATGAFIAATFLQILYSWLRHRKIEKTHAITFIIGIVLGGATILLHDELFIKWKPTVIYWLLAIVFLGSQFIGKKSVLQSMMEQNIALPKAIWTRLNFSWILFFIAMGTLNLYVMSHFDTNTWVDFKLFGLLGLTFVFVMVQGLFLSRHVKPDEHS